MEEKKDEEESTLNEGEAEVAMAHAKRLLESGVQASDIGIIAPYAAQVLYFIVQIFLHCLQVLHFNNVVKDLNRLHLIITCPLLR